MNENMDADMEKKVIDLSKETLPLRICLPKGSEYTILEDMDIVVNAPDPFDFVPKSWEEIVEKYNIDREDSHRLFDYTYFENTEEQEAFIALAQLRLLWHDWVKVLGEPKMSSNWYKIKHDPATGMIYPIKTDWNGVLIFKEQSHAEKFIECFPELLDKAKILL